MRTAEFTRHEKDGEEEKNHQEAKEKLSNSITAFLYHLQRYDGYNHIVGCDG